MRPRGAGPGQAAYCGEMATAQPDVPADAELARAAQAGETGALGLLLARHRAALLAVAVSMVGYGPDAEDAVQDACLLALGHIGELRDPAAAGGWLRAVVRNVCRRQYLSRPERPAGDRLAAVLRSGEPDPARLLERQATRDWVWRAMEDLTPPLRLVLMFRYFTGVTAYQDIAQACGVPVGTVRSRLSEARGRLVRGLLATAEDAHPDVAALTRARRRDMTELLAAVRRGEPGPAFAASWAADVEITGPAGSAERGYGQLIRQLDRDQADGVGYRPVNIVASPGLELWEFDLVSPARDPGHCPPGAGWTLHLRSGLVERARLFHRRQPLAARAAAPAAAM